MFKVKKEGRILTVNETEKAHYLSEGYDVVEVIDGKYEVVEKATGGRTYTVAEYNAVNDELEQLKNSKEGLDDGSLEIVKEQDKRINELIAENEALKAQLLNGDVKLSYAEVKEALSAKGVEFKGNDSHENLLKLLEENA